MNLLPIAAGAAVVAVVPPLRKRVLPIAVATTGAVVGTGQAVVTGAASVAFTAVEGVVGVGRAVLHGPGDAPAEG